MNLFQHLVCLFSAFSRRIFHPRPCLPAPVPTEGGAGRHRKGFSDANLIKGGSPGLRRFGIVFTIIGFKIQYLSLLKYRGTLIYPVRNNAPLEFLTGFTSGAIFSIIFMIACGARFPSEQVEPPRAEARGSSTCFVGRNPPKQTPLRSYELRRVPSMHSSTAS